MIGWLVVLGAAGEENFELHLSAYTVMYLSIIGCMSFDFKCYNLGLHAEMTQIHVQCVRELCKTSHSTLCMISDDPLIGFTLAVKPLVVAHSS